MRRPPALLAAACLLGVSCSDAQLEPVPPPEAERADNKLEVSGSFCTTDPDELDFPVKIYFIIDTSQSMAATDPNLTRLDAVLDVISLVENTPGVEIALQVFGAGNRVLTERCDTYNADPAIPDVNCQPGFSPPLEAVTRAGDIAFAGGTTDFVLALQTAVSTLATDLALQSPDDLQNARYVMIFLSDGIPDNDSRFDPVDTCEDAAEWELTGEPPRNSVDVVEDVDILIQQFKDLANQYNVRELTFNSAFAAAPDTATEVKACGTGFMRGMSNKGDGVFRDFSSGEPINFLFVDFTSFKRVFAMKNFTATNINARPFSAALGVDPRVRSDDPTLALGIIDSDGDAVSDQVEELVGSDPLQQDTDNDGFSDLLEHSLKTSGLDLLDPTDADCAGDTDRQDTDGDGLRDCEEIFFGVLKNNYDSDNDGFGDGIEILYGSNPSLPDTFLDIDFDGVNNSGEMRAHSRVDTDDVVELSEHAYRYKVSELPQEGATLCYEFNVSNVALATTAGADAPPPDALGIPQDSGLGGGAMLLGENRVIFEVTESPFDEPGESGVARLACARARFDATKRLKDPANGKMILPREAFKPATEFDPAIDCIDP